MEVIWSDLAHKSLLGLLTYISNNFGQRKANDVLQYIRNIGALLGGMPRIGTVVEEWEQYGEVRKVVHKRNSIYYHICGEKLIIIIVWDTRQNPLRLEDSVVRYFTSLELEQ